MITLSEAIEMFNAMINDTKKGYQVEDVWEIDFEEPIYVATVSDANGDQFLPGELFPCIKKKNGELIDWKFPPTG